MAEREHRSSRVQDLISDPRLYLSRSDIRSRTLTLPTAGETVYSLFGQFRFARQFPPRWPRGGAKQDRVVCCKKWPGGLNWKRIASSPGGRKASATVLRRRDHIFPQGTMRFLTAAIWFRSPSVHFNLF